MEIESRGKVRSGLLYGRRQPQAAGLTISYQALVDKPWLMPLPSGYCFHHQERVDRQLAPTATRFFVSNRRGQLIEGLLDRSERLLAFNYFNRSADNERPLLAYLAKRLSDDDIVAELRVAAGQGETRLAPLGRLDSFLSRYGHHFTLAAVDGRYETDEAKLLARLFLLKLARQRPLTPVSSLRQLLSLAGGAEFVLAASFEHDLALRAPLVDLS